MKTSWGNTQGLSADRLRAPRPPMGKRGPKHVQRVEDDKRAEALRRHLFTTYPEHSHKQFAAMLGWSATQITVLMAGESVYPKRVAPCRVDEAIMKLQVKV
jgi:hypothetical protein